MVKKVAKKKAVKKKKSVSLASKPVSEDVSTPSGVTNNEDRQLMWFFAVVLVLFAAVLVPYFYVESQKSFEYGGIDWTIEEAGVVELFHGRFPTLNVQYHVNSGRINYHNIYLRNDPRKNDVPVSGSLDNFKLGAVVSVTPEFNECRGDIPRVMVDFFDFLTNGVGMAQVEVATTSASVANETSMSLVDCSYNESRTVVVFDVGGDSGIVVSDTNPNCYTVTVDTCNNILPVEKFMVRSVTDFRSRYGDLVLE